MESEEKKLVALDIGGVCVNLHFADCMRAFGLDPQQKLPDEFVKLDFLLETGRISEDDFLHAMEKLLTGRMTPAEIRQAWSLAIGPDIPGMADAVRSLLPQYKFVYFSNTSRFHLDDVVMMNGFGHLVTGGIYSFSAHAMKPDPVIYEAFEQTYGVPYAYFDDRAENIEAAKKRGWNAFVYHSPEEFLRILGQ